MADIVAIKNKLEAENKFADKFDLIECIKN